MDLNHQIAALFVIGFSGSQLTDSAPIVRDIREGGLGGVVLFSRCLHDPDQPGNIVSPDSLRRLTAALRALRPDPPLICIDQEGGAVKRLAPANGFPDFPSARQMAAVGIEETGRQAERTAALLADLGITVNFAPVVDIDRVADNPIIGALGRSFGNRAELVSDHAAAWIRGHRKHGIISCIKHFPGHGSSISDSHLGFVDVTGTWHEEELQPYHSLLNHDLVDMVMTGHLFNRRLDPRYPATLSPATITGLLRRHLGFDGVVISDDLQMQAITEHYRLDEALCLALAAGVDLLLIGNNLVYYPDLLRRCIAAVRSGIERGALTTEQIACAYRRVQNLKKRQRINANETHHP